MGWNNKSYFSLMLDTKLTWELCSLYLLRAPCWWTHRQGVIPRLLTKKRPCRIMIKAWKLLPRMDTCPFCSHFIGRRSHMAMDDAEEGKEIQSWHLPGNKGEPEYLWKAFNCNPKCPLSFIFFSYYYYFFNFQKFYLVYPSEFLSS